MYLLTYLLTYLPSSLASHVSEKHPDLPTSALAHHALGRCPAAGCGRVFSLIPTGTNPRSGLQQHLVNKAKEPEHARAVSAAGGIAKLDTDARARAAATAAPGTAGATLAAPTPGTAAAAAAAAAATAAAAAAAAAAPAPGAAPPGLHGGAWDEQGGARGEVLPQGAHVRKVVAGVVHRDRSGHRDREGVGGAVPEAPGCGVGRQPRDGDVLVLGQVTRQPFDLSGMRFTPWHPTVSTR